MLTQDQRNDMQDCKDLVLALTQLSDHGEDEAATDLFVPHATWLRGGKLLKGRAEILASFGGRAPGKISRHTLTPTRITLTGKDTADGMTYFISYSSEGDPNGPWPRPFPMPFSMGEYLDKFVRTPQGWRFIYREVNRLYQRQ